MAPHFYAALSANNMGMSPHWAGKNYAPEDIDDFWYAVAERLVREWVELVEKRITPAEPEEPAQ